MTPSQQQLTPFSRSLVLLHRACPRRGFLTYRYKASPQQVDGGIQSPRQSPDLAIGTALHLANETLLLHPDYPLAQLVNECLATPEILNGQANGFSLVEPANLERFMAHLRTLITGMCWIMQKHLVPSLLSTYKVTKVEHEFKPYAQGQFALQGRTDAIFEGDFGEPVIGSMKTAAVYSQTSAGMQEYDTQGLTESWLYFQEFGTWPGVQMYTLIKGLKRKQDGMVTYEGPLTKCYRKVYVKDGRIAWSADYTSGWDKMSVEDYPGGALVYYRDVLSQSPQLERTWARPMATSRSQAAAADCIGHMFNEVTHWFSNTSNELADHAPHHEDCLSFGGLCGFHEPCQRGVPLVQLDYVPRKPHHPNLLEEED